MYWKVLEKFNSDALFEVQSQELRARYNSALQRLGIEATTLSSFSIDASGWSPEIATEKADDRYLSAGATCPMAVILSPEQANLPVLLPFNSYDDDLIQVYFERLGSAIAEITRKEAIAVTIDHSLTRYEQPSDLLLIDHVSVRSDTGKLGSAFQEQDRLVQKFMTAGEECLNPNLRLALIDSAKLHGDLRSIKAEIPELTYAEFSSFHSWEFEGVFVLRKQRESKPMLILEQAKKRKSIEFELQDRELFHRLLREEFFEINPSADRENPAALEYKREALISELLCRQDPELDLSSLTEFQRKQRLRGCKSEELELLSDLERYLKLAVRTGSSKDDLSPELQFLLASVNQDLAKSTQAVLCQLLLRFRELDPLELYLHDRKFFCKRYFGWNPAKQRWAEELVRKHLT